MEAKTRYAKSGDVHIAYRVFGDGPRDLVLVPGTVSHVELFWELPVNAYILERLASFSRVIVFDKRGQGLSDRVANQTLDERVGDLLAVMDAASSQRATVYGWSEGGQMCVALAATHPERVAGLVLYATYASMQAPPWSLPPERHDLFLAAIERHWGEGILVRVNAPQRVADKAFVEWFGRLERAVASPSAILSLLRANYALDCMPFLPSIRVPTLVLHRAGDALVPVEAGRALAEGIPGARFIELPGVDHMLQALDQDVLDLLLNEIEKFVTGRLPEADRAPTWAAGIIGPGSDLPLPPGGDDGGALEDAIAELERCREVLVSGDDDAGIAGLVARAQAVVAAERGAWEESEALFIKAAETFRHHGMVWQEARTFQSWGQALRAGADRRGAIAQIDTALDIYRRHAASRPAVGGVERGRTGADGADGAARNPRAAASSGATFRREGEYWTVSSGESVVRLKNAKGLHYIRCLLANPGREFLACDLAGGGVALGNRVMPAGARGTAADLGDAGALLDEKARGQYRRRIHELNEELEKAVHMNDVAREAALRCELDFLREQIVAAVGLGGRHRKASAHAERARVMVTKAIKTAIAKIRASDAVLGRHLATSVKTGHCCSYDPGPTPPIAWRF